MLRFRTGPGVEPQEVPRPQRGDVWIVLGLFVGAILGAVAGGVITEALDFNPFVGIIVGALIGGFAGTFAGDRIKKYLIRRRQT